MATPSTPAVNASVGPVVSRYLGRLAGRLETAGYQGPLFVILSHGGVAPVEEAARLAVGTALSGPAGGVAAAVALAAQGLGQDLVTFDMGGTSTDIALVTEGEAALGRGRTVGGERIALESLDIVTLGAGGGSIAHLGPGGTMQVGPRSAGAVPGPACYGLGGAEPTVTDANLVLGYLGGGDLAGGVGLDRGAAERAVGGLARELDLDLVDCAEGIARVATAEMAQALRVMTVERGVDPRGYALLAFGGAGPMHAAAIADELGMERILCPPTSGVLAALGLVVGERRRDAQRSLLLSGDDLAPESVSEAFGELAGRARDALGEPEAPLRAAYDLRYRGQAFELPVERDGNEPASPQELREGFAAAFAERYGYTEDKAGVELVTLRVTAALPGPTVSLERAAGGGASAPESTRQAVFDSARVEAAVWRGELAPGTRLEGPAVCELPEATLVVAPGWSGEVDATGAVGLERS